MNLDSRTAFALMQHESGELVAVGPFLSAELAGDWGEDHESATVTYRGSVAACSPEDYPGASQAPTRT